MPTFFFSHAGADRNFGGNYLDKFFDDLKAQVALYVGVDPARVELGTIDREILQGADWDQSLSSALQTNRTFVAVLSPTFFGSENCGKELFGFLLRSDGMGYDTNGQLTGVKNVLAIRWMPQDYYDLNAERDARIPPIVRRIENRRFAPYGVTSGYVLWTAIFGPLRNDFIRDYPQVLDQGLVSQRLDRSRGRVA